MSDRPNDRQYTHTHEWVRIDDDGTAEVGLTDYAVEQLGDLVFLDLPAEGAAVEAGSACGEVESVKAVSDLYSPVSGTVTAFNQDVLDDPGAIGADPFASGWLFRVEGATAVDGLVDAEGYASVVAEEAH